MSKLSKEQLDEINSFSAERLLKWTFEHYGKQVAIGTSFQKTGTVIIDITSRVVDSFRVYFVDTLRHPESTYEFIKSVEARYNIDVEILKPDTEELQQLNNQQGQWGHLFSAKERKRCCQVRKINPARRLEADLEAVVSGLRADQSAFRAANMKKAYYENREDGGHILKINPMFEWTEADLDDYIAENDVQIHPLYDYESEHGEKYKVIGCGTCHFPVQPDRPARSGKFPWERSEKECGLHYKDGGGI